MQNLFFKKFLLCVIVINSSLLFSSEMRNGLIINNENAFLINDSVLFNRKTSNKVVNFDQFNNKDVEYFLNDFKCSKSKNVVFLPNNNEIAELNIKQNNTQLVDLNEDNIKTYLTENLQSYSNNLLEDNIQFQALYYTIKHINKNNNVYKEKEQNNDVLLIQQLLLMIKNIERKQKLLFSLQNINIKEIELKIDKMAQQIQVIELNNIVKQLIAKKEQESLNPIMQKLMLNQLEQNAKELAKKEQEWKEKEQELGCCSCVIL